MLASSYISGMLTYAETYERHADVCWPAYVSMPEM
jgi:hypothetical protein